MKEYFSDKELQCKGTGMLRLAVGFRDRINQLRETWGKPLIVNSCCRSKAYNDSEGGHHRSLHVCDFPYHPTGGTCAIDIREVSDDFRNLAYSHGFSLGLGKTFTHLDDRTRVLNFPQVRFNYG